MNSVLTKTEPAFNQDFTDTNTSRIVNEIKSNGYFAFDQALNERYIDKLLQEIDFNKILLNTNDVGVVLDQDIQFLTHCLACSKRTYDVITSPKILDICKGYFTDTFRLTNHRIYKTCKSSNMPWHTDNNKQEGDHLSEKHTMPGLLFLFYLTDVDKNAFQLIKDSHNWSQKHSNELYLSNSYVESKYKKDILTFILKKGSLIVCSTHAIHRAKPFNDKSYKRITLLFQVDEVGFNNEGHGEKNIVNTEYLEDLSPELMDYLGFGFKRNYPAFPTTSMATMPLHDIFRLQNQLVSKMCFAIGKRVIKAILPASALINVKQLRWRLRTKKGEKQQQ